MDEFSDVSHSHGQELVIGVVSHELKTSLSIEAKAGASGFGAVMSLAVYYEAARPAGRLLCIDLADQSLSFD